MANFNIRQAAGITTTSRGKVKDNSFNIRQSMNAPRGPVRRPEEELYSQPDELTPVTTASGHDAHQGTFGTVPEALPSRGAWISGSGLRVYGDQPLTASPEHNATTARAQSFADEVAQILRKNAKGPSPENTLSPEAAAAQEEARKQRKETRDWIRSVDPNGEYQKDGYFDYERYMRDMDPRGAAAGRRANALSSFHDKLAENPDAQAAYDLSYTDREEAKRLLDGLDVNDTDSREEAMAFLHRHGYRFDQDEISRMQATNARFDPTWNETDVRLRNALNEVVQGKSSAQQTAQEELGKYGEYIDAWREESRGENEDFRSRAQEIFGAAEAPGADLHELMTGDSPEAVDFRAKVDALADDADFKRVDWTAPDGMISRQLTELYNYIDTAYPNNVNWNDVYSWDYAYRETERRKAEAQAREDEYKKITADAYAEVSSKPGFTAHDEASDTQILKSNVFTFGYLDSELNMRLIDYLTPQEKATLVEYLGESEDKAKQFFDSIAWKVRDKYRVGRQEELTEAAQNYPVLTSVYSVFSNLEAGAQYPAAMIATMLGDANTAYYFSENSFDVETIRGAVTDLVKQKAGSAAGFYLNAAYSIIDNLAAVFVSGGVPGREASAFSGFLIQMLMSSEAGSNALFKAIANGGDFRTKSEATKAAALSIADFAAEWVTEKYSIENLLSTPTTSLSYLLKNIITEGSEEIASNWLSRLLDKAITGKEYELDVQYQALVANGYEPRDAVRIILESVVKEDAVAGLSGALSGGVMAGGGLGINAGQSAITNYSDSKTAQELNASLPENYQMDGSAFRGFFNRARTGSQTLETVTGNAAAASLHEQQEAERLRYEADVQQGIIELNDAESNMAAVAPAYYAAQSLKTAVQMEEMTPDEALTAAQEINDQLPDGEQIDPNQYPTVNGYVKAVTDKAISVGEHQQARVDELNSKYGEERTKRGHLMQVDLPTQTAEAPAAEQAAPAQEKPGIPPTQYEAPPARSEREAPAAPASQQEEQAPGKPGLPPERYEAPEQEQPAQKKPGLPRDYAAEAEQHERKAADYAKVARKGAAKLYGMDDTGDFGRGSGTATVRETGASGEIDNVHKAGDGQLQVDIKGEDGTVTTHNLADVDVGDAATDTLLTFLDHLGSGASAAYNLYRASNQTVSQFISDMQVAETYSSIGLSEAQALQRGQGIGINPVVMRTGFRLAQTSRAQQDTFRARRAADRYDKVMKNVAPEATSNMSEFLQGRSDITPERAQNIQVLDSLIRAAGWNVNWTASDVDAHGARVGDNGSYDHKNNTITLDAFAGNMTAADAGIKLYNTAMHEMTHAIRAASSQSDWTAFKNWVLSTATEQNIALAEDVTAKVNRYMAGDKNNAPKTRQEAQDIAEEEAVAEACEKIKISSENLAAVAQQNPGLIEKIKSAIKDIVARLRDAVDKLRASSLREAKPWADAMEKQADELDKRWNELLAKARENIQAAREIVTTPNGAVVSSEIAEIMESDEYHPPEEERWSKRYTEEWKAAHRQNYPNDPNFEANAALIDQVDNLTIMDSVLRYATPHGIMPQGRAARSSDKWAPIRDNVEYIFTFDLDTICDRTTQYRAYKARIEQKLHRQLTEMESRNLIELMRAYGQMIPCTYCYVETKRMALADGYLKYIKKNNAQLPDGIRTAEAVFDEVEKARTLTYQALDEAYLKDENFTTDERTARGDFSGYRDFRLPVTEAEAAEAVFKRLGVTEAQAKKVISGFVAEWNYARSMDVPTNLVDQDSTLGTDTVNQSVLSFHKKATTSAQGGAKARSVSLYEPYIGQLSRISYEDFLKINAHGGIRKHSSNDFQIQNLQDYMLLYMDLAADRRNGKGWFGHTYTKSLEFARIFAPTNDMINVSIAMYGRTYDTIRANAQEGVEWEGLRELKAELDAKGLHNVGAMAMVTNNAQLAYALDMDWIDMIIPFHASGMKKSLYKSDALAWTDYTSKQLEKFYNKKQKMQMLRDAGVEVKSSMSAAEVNALYDEKFKPKKLWSKEKQKYIPPHFEPYDIEIDGQKIEGHHNDRETYLRLCREYGVNPRFYGVQITTGDGRTMDVTEHPNYIKLVKETARTDYAQKEIVAEFDMDYANGLLNDYKNRRDVGEDTFNIVNTFVEEYAGKNRPYGWMSEKTRDAVEFMRQSHIESERAKLEREKKSLLNSIRENSAEEAPADTGVMKSERRDADYDAAVKRGDMDEAQRMVDDAAKAAGYDVRAYHGTPTGGFTVFDVSRLNNGKSFGNWIYYTSDMGVASEYTRTTGRTKGEIKPMVYDSYLNLGDTPVTIDLDALREKYGAKKTSLIDFTMRDEISKNKDKASAIVIKGIRDGSSTKSTVYMVRDSSQVKSADPVTYDNNGKVIPLSERFNRSNPDIRYSTRQQMTPREAARNALLRERATVSLTNTVKAMRKQFTTNNRDSHVPDVLKAPVAQLLIDMRLPGESRIGSKKNRTLAESMYRMANILNSVVQAQLNPDTETKQAITSVQAFENYLDMPEEIADTFSAVAEKLSETSKNNRGADISGLDTDDLVALARALQVMRGAVNRANALIDNGRYKTVKQAGQDSYNYLRGQRDIKGNKKHGAVFNRLFWSNATPVYAFDRFGDAGKAIFTELMDGQDKLARRMNEIIDTTHDMFTQAQAKAWDEHKNTFELSPSTDPENKVEVTVTDAQLMSLYALSKRPQGLQHIMAGGIRVGEIGRGKNAINDARHYILTQEDLDTMLGALSDEQKIAVDKMVKYMSTTLGEWGNEVTLKRFGVRFYTEDNYFPIRTDSSMRPAAGVDRTHGGLYRLLNMSFTQSLTPRANNAVVLDSVTDVYADHAADMALYSTMALPSLDVMKWLNYRASYATTDENGVKHPVQVSLANEMDRVYGGEAVKYVTELIKSINGTDVKERGMDFISKMTSHFKVAAVGANLSVAMLQPVSYIRAANEISPVYLAAALKHKPQVARMKQVTGIGLWKSQGNRDFSVSRGLTEEIKDNRTLVQKAQNLSLKGAELMDSLTWGTLFNAVELELGDRVKRGEIDVERGTPEWDAAVNERFREIIYRTQVVDSVLTRSDIMRNHSSLMKILTAFKAEPTVTANVLLEKAWNFAMDRQNGKSVSQALRNNAGGIARALTVYAASGVFEALVRSLVGAFRDDDDYETFRDKFMQQFFNKNDPMKSQLLAQLNPFDLVPVVSQVWETLINGEDVTVNAFNSLSGLRDAALAIYNKFTKGTGTDYRVAYKLAQAASYLTGIPFSSAMRDAVAAWDTVMDATGNQNLKLQTAADTRKNGTDALYAALANGDNAKAADIRRQLKENGEDEKKVNSNITANIRADYLAGEIDEAEAQRRLERFTGMDPNDAYYKVTEYAYTAQGWGSFSKADTVVSAALNGDPVSTMREFQNKTGKSEKQAVSDVWQRVRTLWQAGRLTDEEALRVLTKACNFTRTEANAKLTEWKKAGK